MSDLPSARQIGRSIPRLEARDKVTGRAEYVHHLRLPGMLHGKIFRSTMPHAIIKKIDVSAAAALKGVFRVVTVEDIKTVLPHPYYGPAFHDQAPRARSGRRQARGRLQAGTVRRGCRLTGTLVGTRKAKSISWI